MESFKHLMSLNSAMMLCGVLMFLIHTLDAVKSERVTLSTYDNL